MMEEKLMLKKNYEKMSDEELLDRLAEGKTQYTQIAYELLLEEAQKRGIANQLNKPKELKSIEKADTDVAINKAQKRGRILICIGIWILFGSLAQAVRGVEKSGQGILAAIINVLIDGLIGFILVGWIGLLLIKKGQRLLNDAKGIGHKKDG